MVNHVRSTDEVNRNQHSPLHGFGPIEAGLDVIDDVQEGGGGGARFAEAVLVISQWDGLLEVDKNQTFKYLCRWGEERDGPVTGTLVLGLVWLQQGDDAAHFPDGRDVGLVYAAVEDIGQETYAIRS